MLVDELVQVREVLQQLPARAERGRNQFDQRFGIIRGDVFVREGRAECARVRSLGDAPRRRDAQRFPFDALAPTLDDAGLAAVDQRRECLFELAIDGGAHEGRHLAGTAASFAISL
jgi:hypothetical protein